MDHHLHQQQSVESGKKWLSLDRGETTFRIGQEAGSQYCHRGSPHFADVTRIEPMGDQSVMRPKAPIFVHHKSYAGRQVPNERLRVAQNRRETASDKELPGPSTLRAHTLR